jgi:hypothetical protein
MKKKKIVIGNWKMNPTTLKDAKAMVLLHGYRSPLYDELFSEWHSIDHHALTQNGNTRVETLWINPPAWEALRAHDGKQIDMF